MRVCLGGTFNRFHKGHKLLINTALDIAESDGFVFIGISNGALLNEKKYVEPFEKRRDYVISFLQSKKQTLPTILVESIESEEGPTLSMDFDVIIVSEETQETAKRINEKRKHHELKPMKIITIPLVLADDDKKISSTRIVHNEIDSDGHVL